MLRTVVAHQCVYCVTAQRILIMETIALSRLKTWTRQEGAVRLSEDDGPPAHTFLDEHDDEREEEDSESGDDDSVRQEDIRRVPPVELQRAGITRVDGPPPSQDRN